MMLIITLLAGCMGDVSVKNADWSAVGLFTIDVHGTICNDCWVYEDNAPIGMANERIMFEHHQDQFAFRFGNMDPETYHTRDNYPLIVTGYHGNWVVPELVTPLEGDATNEFPVVANRAIEGNWTCWVDESPQTVDVTVTKGHLLELPGIDATLDLTGEEMTGHTTDGFEIYGFFLDVTTIDLSFRHTDGTDHVLCWEGEHADMPRE